jgi:hypothetical protein
MKTHKELKVLLMIRWIRTLNLSQGFPIHKMSPIFFMCLLEHQAQEGQQHLAGLQPEADST